jgi:hypothetical protein
LTILTILHGQELVWICIASCSTGVVINAVVLFWLTHPGQDNDEPDSTGGHVSNHRSETGKGGVVRMHRISVNHGLYHSRQTGSFNGTSSMNGMTKTGRGTSATPDDAPRPPLKVNFSGYPRPGVYDGSAPGVREHIPSTNDKLADSATTPASNFHQPQNDLHSLFNDQKRQSTGFVYERKVTKGSEVNRSSSPPGFLSRFIGKLSPSDGGKTGFSSNPASFGGGRGGRGSDEEVGVRITVATTHEGDNILDINDSEAGDPKRAGR